MPESGEDRAPGPRGSSTPAPYQASDAPGSGQMGPAILASGEHWSLLASRSLLWSEAMSRATGLPEAASTSISALPGQRPTRPASEPTPSRRALMLAAEHWSSASASRPTAAWWRSSAMRSSSRLAMNLSCGMPACRSSPALKPYVATGQHDGDSLTTSYVAGGRRRAVGPVPGRLGGAVLAATPRPGPATPYDAEVPHAARQSLNDLPVRLPRSSQWSAAARTQGG